MKPRATGVYMPYTLEYYMPEGTFNTEIVDLPGGLEAVLKHAKKLVNNGCRLKRLYEGATLVMEAQELERRINSV
jgi:hypothetical protein